MRLLNSNNADSLINDSKKVLLPRKIRRLAGALFQIQQLGRKADCIFDINQFDLENALFVLRRWIVKKWSKLIDNQLGDQYN